MAKFVYRMQSILDIKEKLESQARMEFAQANRRYQDEMQILQDYVVRRTGYEKKLRDTMTGTIDIQEVGYARANLSAMRTLVRRQMMEVNKAEKALDEAREALNEVMKDRKVHEKLREHAFDEFKKEINAQENKEIDELVSYRFNAR
ncbi:MAG: flagellar export protein FliJ [Clostridiales bacterium]|nr:flagellar export protein FliJ [Clostridiales bacterium]